jgi:hypothetical protein
VTASARPTLLNGCASAATASEARFRIDRPIRGGSARVVGLDAEAAEIVRRVAGQPWGDARFLTGEELTLRLDEELADADVVVMIATCDDGAEAASAIARACADRGITTAGLILGEKLEVGAAVSALRPYARILMATDDEDDVSEVLTALRA